MTLRATEELIAQIASLDKDLASVAMDCANEFVAGSDIIFEAENETRGLLSEDKHYEFRLVGIHSDILQLEVFKTALAQLYATTYAG